MMISDRETFDVAHSLQPGVRNATAAGAAVDLQNFNAATILVTAGAWTDGTHAVTILESADNATFAAVPAAQLDGALPSVTGGGSASQTYRLGYLGNKRYLRVDVTVAGATTGAVIAATVLRRWARKAPK